jgi:hypothetical protein
MRRVTPDRSIVGRLTVNLGAAHDAAIVSRRHPVVKCTASHIGYALESQLRVPLVVGSGLLRRRVL